MSFAWLKLNEDPVDNHHHNHRIHSHRERQRERERHDWNWLVTFGFEFLNGRSLLLVESEIEYSVDDCEAELGTMVWKCIYSKSARNTEKEAEKKNEEMMSWDEAWWNWSCLFVWGEMNCQNLLSNRAEALRTGWSRAEPTFFPFFLLSWRFWFLRSRGLQWKF